MDPLLIVFAKSPSPGHVKTRLIPAIGPGRAAHVQALMTAATLRRARTWPCSNIVLAGCPGPEAFDPGVADLVLPQGAGDLGQRLRRVQQAVFAEFVSPMLIVGTDAPDLPDDQIVGACRSLARGRAVICPADDGGYCLVGVPRPLPELFTGVVWGGCDVATRTRELATRHGIALDVTEPWFDVDTIDDLRALCARIADSADPALRDLHTGLNCEKLAAP